MDDEKVHLIISLKCFTKQERDDIYIEDIVPLNVFINPG